MKNAKQSYIILKYLTEQILKHGDADMQVFRYENKNNMDILTNCDSQLYIQS